jgi:hypothetical protein
VFRGGEAVALSHEPGLLAGWAVLIVGNILVLQAGTRAWRWSGNAASASTRSWPKALVLSICVIGLVAVVDFEPPTSGSGSRCEVVSL